MVSLAEVQVVLLQQQQPKNNIVTVPCFGHIKGFFRRRWLEAHRSHLTTGRSLFWLVFICIYLEDAGRYLPESKMFFNTKSNMIGKCPTLKEYGLHEDSLGKHTELRGTLPRKTGLTKALLRGCLNNPLINPYFCETLGGIGGVGPIRFLEPHSSAAKLSRWLDHLLRALVWLNVCTSSEWITPK